jgi:arylformamidase
VSSSSSHMTPEVAEAIAAIRGLSVFDVSPDIEPGMPMWFLYEGPEISPILVRETHGAVANRIALSEHTGSHVDAPFHFDPDGLTIGEVAADALFLRPYKKYALADDDPQPGDLIGLERLKAAEARGAFQLHRGDVAVMEMGWDRYFPNGADEREDGWWGRNQPGLSQRPASTSRTSGSPQSPQIPLPVTSPPRTARFSPATVTASTSCPAES